MGVGLDVRGVSRAPQGPIWAVLPVERRAVAVRLLGALAAKVASDVTGVGRGERGDVSAVGSE